MNDPLYRKEILRLAANAAGAGRLVKPSASATLHNPACGDRITVDVMIAEGRITALTHHTSACVLTQASAAILGADATGLNHAEIATLAASVRSLLAGGSNPAAPFDSYAAFDGLLAHKPRHKCVLLPLEAVLEALEMLELPKPGA